MNKNRGYKVVGKVLSGFYFLSEFLKTYLSINLAIGKNRMRMSIEKNIPVEDKNA